LIESARVLELELLTARTRAIYRRKLFRAFGFPALCDNLYLLPKLRLLVRLGAHSGCPDDDGDRAIRVVNTKVKRGKSPHREPYEMGLVDLEVIQHVNGVFDRAPLRIFLYQIRNLGGRISPRIVCDAAVTATKIPHLKLPGAIVSGKFVDEQDCSPGAAVLVIKLNAITCGQVWHRISRLLVVRLTTFSQRVKLRRQPSSQRSHHSNTRTRPAPLACAPPEPGPDHRGFPDRSRNEQAG